MVYIIIDMQNDFLTGSLKNEDAVSIVDNIIWDIRSLEKEDVIILTRDTHGKDYLKTKEGSYLPYPHCIKGTIGHEIEPRIMKAVMESNLTYSIVNKPTFGYLGWKEGKVGEILSTQEKAVLVGTCTDICVASNALILKAIYPDLTVQVKESSTAATSQENQAHALAVLRSCQVEII